MKFRNLLMIIMVAGFAFFAFACGNTDAHTENDGHHHSGESAKNGGHAGEGEGESSATEVHLTREQITAIGLKTGAFTPRKMAGYFSASGTIELPPQSIASVNAPEVGFVKEVRNYVVGSPVKKGAVLATLEHPLYIQKQQEYLETISELTWLQQELERQKTLSEANANALKAFQKAQSDVKVMTARKKGLEQYLKYLGIDAGLLQNGEIRQTISLTAPLSGYLTEVNIHKGLLVKPETKLYAIVNNDHVHLELHVFEKDIGLIEEGQKVSFKIPSFGRQQFEAEVHQVGRAFDADNKTIRVHCHLIGEQPKFMRGLYAEAKIWQDEQTVNALPEDAVIRADGSEYIFIQVSEEGDGEVAFRPVAVRTGEKDGDFLEVIPVGELPAQAKIVTQGAYYLMAEMKKG
ncbi:MAG: efflux RND transporter periplasmic adaptor subunit, partial [Saprospiraceae bacterium]